MESIRFPYYSGRSGDELTYRVNKGLLVVFDFFNNNVSQDNDYFELIKYFKELNFGTESYNVSCRENFITKCSELASCNKIQDYDCIVVLISSIGDESSINCNDRLIDLNEIIDLFNGKMSKISIQIPKIFFIQTCTGDECDNVNFNSKTTSNIDIVKTLPSDANVLVAYSTTSCKQNSWFIECLLAVFKEYSKKEDLLTMLTRVNREMYSMYMYDEDEKMISSQISQLTYKVFIN
ncbi:caspase-7 isoform X2 [Hydra vulgaris]|uniref:Caspase-7 isoform X2 n=1 Tax=Hydra vulgaris TaxID=6087 RepID=A0ABM4BIT2_HYDVU